MVDLHGQVGVVTGASRGIGKGVARALADAGVVVYATGRTISTTSAGLGIEAVVCDHADDVAVTRVFDRVRAEQGRIDILVNCAWGGYENMVESGQFTWPARFWEQPRWRWDAMVTVGVRSAYIASQEAARSMVPARSGLIVHLSHWAAQKYIGNVVYGVSKAATDKMAADMAHELAPHNVTVLSLYPGLVRTEAVLAAGFFDLSNSESPEYIGRAVGAVASDPDRMRWTGKTIVAASLGETYGFDDVDGKKPQPLTLLDV